MASGVTIRDNGALALLKRARELQHGARVRVGVLHDEAKRERAPLDLFDEPSDDGEFGSSTASAAAPPTLLEVAISNEFGDPARHVPQRSFIRATVDEHREEITELETALAMRVLEGKISQEEALSLLGAKVVGLVQARIARGIDPPNSPETVERKGSSKPLVDTGQLRSSITWKVEGP